MVGLAVVRREPAALVFEIRVQGRVTACRHLEDLHTALGAPRRIYIQHREQGRSGDQVP